MKAMKKIISLILGVVLCLGLLAACGGGSTTTPSAAPSATPSSDFTGNEQMTVTGGEVTEDTKFKEHLTVIIDNNKIGSIDPFNAGASSNTTRWALNLSLDRLVAYFNGEYTPELATEWHTEDYQHFNFKLRDDVNFHNGENLTADDVVYTVERAKAAVGAMSNSWLGTVDTVEVVNDYEINITLAKPNVDFLFNLTQAHAGIVNREACEADAEKGFMIGSGPWVVTGFVSNDYVDYTRNEEYWGELPKTKELTLKFVAEEASRLIMLENKEVEVAFSINPVDFPYLEEDDRFDTYSYTVNNNFYVGFNMNDPICGDVNFRKAVAHVIKYDDIVEISRHGYATASRDGTFWGFATEFRNDKIERIPYDIEKAKEYLAKSSYDGSEVEIVTAFPDQLLGAQALQEQLTTIGVKTKIFQTDAPGISSYAKYQDNQCQMICYTGTWNTPASSVRTYYYTGAAANRTSYNNPAINELIDKAAAILDPVERGEVYKQIQAMAAEDIPFVTLYNITHVVGCLKGVAGMTLDAGAGHDLSYVYMVEE